jgi:O-antigen ligase
MIKDITDNYQTYKPYNYDVEGKYKYLKFMFYSPNQTILWISSLNIFMDNKIIGAGPNVFRYVCDQYKPKIDNEYNKCSSHPHNFAFQLLAETGSLGFLIYLCTYLSLLKNLII